MNFRKSAFRILLLTCFLLLVAWVSLQLMVNGWDIETLLRKAQEKIGISGEGVMQFIREQVLPLLESLMEKIRGLAGQISAR